MRTNCHYALNPIQFICVQRLQSKYVKMHVRMEWNGMGQPRDFPVQHCRMQSTDGMLYGTQCVSQLLFSLQTKNPDCSWYARIWKRSETQSMAPDKMQHLYFIVQCTYGYECACACDSPMVVVMQSPEIKQWSWRVRGGWNSILHLLSLLFCTFHFNTNGCRCVLCGETTKVTFSVCEWKSRVGKNGV